jgi:hypothetical protein
MDEFASFVLDYQWFPILVLGILFFAILVERRWEFQRWKKARGRIILAELRLYPKRVRYLKEQYTVTVVYEYIVNGKTYYNRTVSYETDVFKPVSREAGEQLLKQFQPMDTVDVYYDPKQPYKAALLHTRDKKAELQLIIAGVVCLLLTPVVYLSAH